MPTEPEPSPDGAFLATVAALRERFEAAMDDDFNTPQAIGALNLLATALAEERERVRAGIRSGQDFVTGRGRPDRSGPGAGAVDEGTPVGTGAGVRARAATPTSTTWWRSGSGPGSGGTGRGRMPCGRSWTRWAWPWKTLRRARSGSGRRADRALILAGRHPVLEALRSRARPIEEVLVEAEARDRHADILALARQAGVRLSRVPRAALTSLAGTTHHQGVVARVAPREYAELEDLLAVPATRGEPALFLALDQVQDPGNVGNLLRTAEALGVHGVLVPRHQAAGLTPHVVRAAAGALEYLPVARVGNLGQALERLKQAGCWIVGAVAEGGRAPSTAQAPWAADLRGALVLVLGSEGRGLRPLVARTCDLLVRIPLAGRVGSLNVAAAGAALLYEVRRQRQEGLGPGPGRRRQEWG